jgi:hypothetical protein
VKDLITPSTLALGVVLGLLMAPVAPIMSDLAGDWYDGLRPVIVAKVRVVDVDDQRAVIHMEADKRRDCNFVRLVAYTIDADGVRRDAQIRRLDGGQMQGITRGVGKYDLGNWEVVPRLGGRMVRVESVHDCDTRQVRTLLGQVELL